MAYRVWIDGDPQQIRWYKHAGRGQSCALEYTPEQWIAWHDAVHAALWKASEDDLEKRIADSADAQR
jgi:hypothetical protein